MHRLFVALSAAQKGAKDKASYLRIKIRNDVFY